MNLPIQRQIAPWDVLKTRHVGAISSLGRGRKKYSRAVRGLALLPWTSKYRG